MSFLPGSHLHTFYDSLVIHKEYRAEGDQVGADKCKYEHPFLDLYGEIGQVCARVEHNQQTHGGDQQRVKNVGYDF